MSAPLVRIARCLVWLSLVWASLADARAGSAGLIARTWDQEISLPPAGYRAGKPIQMDGSFTVTIVPGTYLEGVDFMGKEHDQKFKIEGALLRKSKLIGQLGRFPLQASRRRSSREGDQRCRRQRTRYHSKGELQGRNKSLGMALIISDSQLP